MPRLFASDDDRDLVRAERDVRAAFTGLDLDLTSLAAVSNIFRAATAVRNHMEGGVLAQHELSWSAFTSLFVLRVWGEMDARTLAAEAGVTAATLTGVMKTLEARQLLRRKTDRADGRRVLVTLTASGRKAVDEIMPAFNRHERLVTQALTEEEQIDLAHVLRTILRTVEAIDL
ncbi:MAG: MarR family transcriptional regulator [Actinomycetia bacterium]|nr:MarR family transcriptional regulator [Actinomycetes bacterium]